MAVLANAQWRVVPVGTFTNADDTNGAGYDGVNYPGGTDYTLEANTPSGLGGPIANFSAGTTTGATDTLIDTTNSPFTSAMVGNCVHIISGTNFTAGFYFIKTFNSTSSIQLDRVCATGAGSAGAYKIGGCWATPDTNMIAGTPIVAGNIINIRGSGSDSPTVNDYTTTHRISLSGSTSAGFITFRGYNGRPRFSQAADNITFVTCNFIAGENLYLPCCAAANGLYHQSGNGYFKNCVFDQNGLNASFTATPGTSTTFIDCEFFSSSAVTGTATILATGRAWIFINCNFHDMSGTGIFLNSTSITLLDCKFVKLGGIALNIAAGDSAGQTIVKNNTFDTISGTCIKLGAASALNNGVYLNNIFSNITGSYAIDCNFGSAAANAVLAQFLNYNNFFNVIAIFHNFTAQIDLKTGSNGDLALDPQYADQTNQGLNIGTNLKAKGFPPQAFMSHTAGITATQSYVDMGASQRQETAGGTTIIIPNQIKNLKLDRHFEMMEA